MNPVLQTASSVVQQLIVSAAAQDTSSEMASASYWSAMQVRESTVIVKNPHNEYGEDIPQLPILLSTIGMNLANANSGSTHKAQLSPFRNITF